MTEREFEKGLVEVRAGVRRAFIRAVVFNVLVVYPIVFYGVFKGSHHAPFREVLTIELVGMLLCAVVFVLVFRALKNVGTVPACPSCGEPFKFKDKTQIINSKKCPACNAVVLQSEAQPGVEAD